MLIDGEVSSVSVSIDPHQNILIGEPVKVTLSLIPKGIAEKIVANLGFTNPFKK